MTGLQEGRAGSTGETRPARHPTFMEAFRFWLKLGFVSFGGPAGQIAIMHEELVEQRRWIGEGRFLHALNFCMLLPGPEAQQLATYVGWLLHGWRGGLAAGVLFVLPSVFILWGLSWMYVTFGEIPWVAAVFYGLKPAVTAIVAAAVIRIGRRALKNEVMWSLAALAFAGIYVFDVPFPLIVIGAGLIGLAGGRLWPGKFVVGTQGGAAGHGPPPGDRAREEKAREGERREDDDREVDRDRADAVLSDSAAASDKDRPPRARSLAIAAAGLLVWWTPVAALGAWRGWGSTLVREGVFFSKAALVTFGGAYAVLPYVAQKAVEDYGWLGAAQMLDGLGLAETTPGPLIMVLQFVGFLGGWNHPEGLPPLAAASLGALITTWVTFVPCFIWIFLGAPYVERLRGNDQLASALSAITAAVVGVILNLAVWFGLHAIFPEPGRLDAFALIVAVVAFAGMLRWRWSIVPVVVGSGVAALLYRMVVGGGS